jgi:hypothetical protein
VSVLQKNQRYPSAQTSGYTKPVAENQVLVRRFSHLIDAMKQAGSMTDKRGHVACYVTPCSERDCAIYQLSADAERVVIQRFVARNTDSRIVEPAGAQEVHQRQVSL